MTDHATITLAKKLRYDLTAMQAKVTDLLNELAKLNLDHDHGPECPHCGIETRGPKTLAEHLYVCHGGPVPAHYADIEARSVEADHGGLARAQESDQEAPE